MKINFHFFVCNIKLDYCKLNRNWKLIKRDTLVNELNKQLL